MLKARLVTGILYIGFVFWLIFSLPVVGFTIAVGILSCLMLFEWMRLAGLDDEFFRLIWLIFFVLLLCLCAWWEPARNLFIAFACIFWFLVFIFVLMRQLYGTQLELFSGVEMLFAFAALVPMFAGLVQLRELHQGELWVLMLFVLLWSSDTFAYVSGKLFGHHKLAPKISPGKTWEGLAGSVVLSLFALMLYSYFVLHTLPSNVLWYAVVSMLVLIATLGDLFESYVKRSHDVKDSGNILPGHGGLLDRLDSMMAAAPVFALLVTQGVL